jgi:hypothetical protein
MDLIGMVEDAAGLTVAAMFAHDSGPWNSGNGGHPFQYWERKWERLGAVEFLVDAKISLPKRLVADAIDDLDALLDDKAAKVFFDSFTNPGSARRTARALRKRLAKMEPEMPFGIVRAMGKGAGPKAKRKTAGGNAKKGRP